MAGPRFRVRSVQFVMVLLLLEPKLFAAADDGGGGGKPRNCNVDLASFLPPPYRNMSFSECRPVWNSFIIRVIDKGDNLVTIVLSAEYATGWIGMGFSKDGLMVGSSAMVGWIGKQGHAKIRQFYLQGSKASEVIANKGELPLTNIPAAIVLHEARIYLAFQLKFERPLHRQPIIFAFGTAYPLHHHLTKHDDKTSIMFSFSGDHGSLQTESYDQFKKNHGILAIFSWGLVLPTGAIAARYFKHKDPLWFYLHTIIQFVGFIFGLSAVVVGQVLYNRIHANFPSHRGIGIFVLVLSILQILAFFARPNTDSKVRKYWNWYHNWFGRLALFFGSLNIVLGIQIAHAGNSWKIGYGFVLGVILAAVIVLEVLAIMRRKEKAAQTAAFQLNPIQ